MARVQVGDIVAHYEIVEHLGRGGMGVVFKARDVRLDRTVALKFLPIHLTSDDPARTRFTHEARAASALDHPNICTVFDIGETDLGQMYIAMAFYDGQSLDHLFEDEPISVERALDLALQIALGLSKAHAADIIHRDIKPANIMVTADGVPKIVDFGLATASGFTTVTQEGSTVGTASYMSPEQARGEKVDERSDQWSLGVVLYEMLTGTRAFAGEYMQAILYSVLNEEPDGICKLNPDVPPELEAVVKRMMSKDPDDRFASTGEAADELNRLLDRERGVVAQAPEFRRILRRLRTPRVAIPAAILLIAGIVAGIWYFDRAAEIRYAREDLIPRIEQMMQTSWSSYVDEYRLAEEAENIISDDPRLADIFDRSSLLIDVTTEPAGADVFFKPYSEPDSEWEFLGTTPVEDERVPVGIFRWRFEKEGYETVHAAATTWTIDLAQGLLGDRQLHRTMDEAGTMPEKMVRVPGFEMPDGRTAGDFFIGRTEVTNREFKEFVDAGGYRDRTLWTYDFELDGGRIRWEEAMERFVDRTGRMGPSTWQAGDYPDGESDYPVTGVSWYEAAAFAEWAGKGLPTHDHWGRARGEQTPLITFPQLGGFATFAQFSNFGRTGPVETASLGGVTSFGAHDMAGNVREWCWNETPGGRLLRGGSWSDNTYRFQEIGQAPAMDRSPQNGFRLALYPDPDSLDDAFLGIVQPMAPSVSTDLEPVADEIFDVYRSRFEYDDAPLHVRVDTTVVSDEFTRETVSFNAAYGGERMRAHVFLPTGVKPPYQTVIYFPGSASRLMPSSADIESYYEFPIFLEFIVKNGRAAIYPVYKGTFERQDQQTARIQMFEASHAHTGFTEQLVKDFRRTVDFVEERDDLDETRLAYYGMSWGGYMGAIIPAVEERIQASVLLPGLLVDAGRPEVHQINYIPRIDVPTLIIAGEYDTISPIETSVQPFYELLGTPEEHKEIRLFPTDHIPPMDDFIRETLDWLDEYLGPSR